MVLENEGQRVFNLVQRDSKLRQRFDDLNVLGCGAQALVVSAREWGSGAMRALKVFPKHKLIGHGSERTRKLLHRELVNNRLLVHPLIVAYQQCIVTSFFVVLVQERVQSESVNRSLYDLVEDCRGLHEDIARFCFQQVVIATEYCHRQGISNRDIKLEHCLVSRVLGKENPKKYILKLCDWGGSKGDHSLPAAKSRVGSPGHWPPEVIIGSFEKNPYNAKLVDSFCLGILLYQLLFGRMMYPELVADVHGDRQLLMDEQRTGDNEPLYRNALRRAQQDIMCDVFPMEVSDDCFAVLSGLLTVDCERRWTMQQVIDSAWFKKDLPLDAQKILNQAVVLPDRSTIQQVRAQMMAIIEEAIQDVESPL